MVDARALRTGRYGRGFSWILLLAAAAAGCAEPAPPAPARGGVDEAARAVAGRAAEERVAWVWAGREAVTAAQASAPRGFGAMTARVPGTEGVVSGVRLVTHRVSAVVRDGFARTTIEEEFQNDTGRVLEGRYAFPLPPDASISRLALYVGDELIEGEIVERPRAARIFKGIVDDTVRPRDPALLEWVSASEFSLKIFPIPAKGRRRVVLAYDQALPEEQASAGGGGAVARYVYPMSLGADRATTIDDFSIEVSVAEGGGLTGVEPAGYPAALRTGREGATVSWAARQFTPSADLVVSYRKAPAAGAPASAYWPEKEPGASGYVALRVRADLPPGAKPPEPRRDRAIVVDVSHSQSRDTLAEEVRLASAMLRSMIGGVGGVGGVGGERFVVLACDSDCETYPADGLAPAGGPEVTAAERWLEQRAPRGSSDLGGALAAAAKRLDPTGAGQVVYIGDGAPTSGELTAAGITGRLAPVLRRQGVELRLFGLGRSVDEGALSGLARSLGATYERVANGEPLSKRGPELTASLRAPVIRDPQLLLPGEFTEVTPKQLPNLRVGQEVLVTARVARGAADAARRPGGAVVPAAHAVEVAKGEGAAKALLLTGTLGGAPYSLEKRIQWGDGDAAQNPLVPRLWAKAKIAELERYPDPELEREAVRLAKEHHVMTRGAALLVLESERMFAEFGIRRTARREADLREDPFAAGGLGLTGVGEGGGGKGEGIGLGNIGTIGHAAGTGTGVGFGSGAGRLGGSHRTSPPKVRMGATSVSGRLPPEVIQRIVRQNFGRFRLCYENGLRNNPNLQGRVAVRFVIGRDGAVSAVGNGGSDLPDSGVVSCVVRAFHGLSFPVPEGGIVTVVYPIMFSPGDGGSWSAPPPPAVRPAPSWQGTSNLGWELRPSAIHRLPGASSAASDAAIAKLTAEVATSGASRQKHAALVRKLLAAGRVQEALTAAARFAELDPDLDTARELLAYAAAANGQPDLALAAVDSLSETSARNASRHARAARAFEAAGDERRACAHWRSLAELTPRDDAAVAEALRCRARMLDEGQAALEEARALQAPGPRVSALLPKLEAGLPPPFDPAAASAGQFEAKVVCAGERSMCPSVSIVKPDGTVISPWTPGAARAEGRGVAFSGLSNGTYRVVAAGGRPGMGAQIELVALGARRTFPVDRTEAHTVALTSVSGME